MAEETINLDFQPNVPDNSNINEAVDQTALNQGIITTPEITLNPPTGGYTPTSIPSVNVDFENIRDQLIIPNSGEPIQTTIDPTVVRGANGLANMMNSNPVIMDYPYNMDPNSRLFRSENVVDDPLGQTILDYNAPELNQTAVSNPIELQPLNFDKKATNYDRYNAPGFKHLFNKIGFHPYVDNETVYNANSTWWDENARMRGQWGRIFSTGFMSTYDAIADAFNGNYLSGDTDGADVFEDAMRIGNSSKSGIGAFTNNLMLNSGYTFGILANIAVEELALAGLEAITVGGATPIVASRTAYNIVRLGKAADKSLDVLKGAKSSANLVDKVEDAATARSFWQNAGRWTMNVMTPNTLKAIKEIKTTQNTAKALSLMAKTAKTAGGFYRDARMFNLAIAESKLEAGLVQNKLYNDLFHEYVAKYGSRPMGDDLKKINNTAQEAAFTTLMWNFPVIFFSNQFVLGTALRGFRGLSGVFGKTAGSLGNRIMRKTATKGAKEAAKTDVKILSKNRLKRIYERGLYGNLRNAGASLLRYSSANLAEGFQEITQEAIAVGAEDYYKNLYRDPAMGGLDAQMASIYSGAKSQMSGQGFEVFMSGFLMGGLVQGPQKLVFNGLPNLYSRFATPEEFAKQKEQEEEYLKEAKPILEEMYNNPQEYFDPNKINAMFQKEASQDMLNSTYDGDVRSFYDKKNALIFNHLYTAASLGKLGDFAQYLEDMSKLDDQMLAEAMPDQSADDIKSGKTRERLTEMSEKADDMRKAFDKLNEEIVNPFDPNLYKEGTREQREEAIRYAAFDHARKMAMFARDQFNNTAKRISSIYNTLSTDPIIAKMAANDIDVLTDIQSLISEINLLKNEIDIATRPTVVTEEVEDEKTGEKSIIEKEEIPELNTEESAALKSKQAKLIALQNIFNVITDPANVTEREIFSDAELEKIEDLTERSKERAARDQRVKIVEDLRKQILSTDVNRDVTLEAIVNIISDKNLMNSFGEFDVANRDKFKKVFVEYLDLLAKDLGDNIQSDKIDDYVDLILDSKSLTQRQQILSKAVRTILAPQNLVSLAERIEPRFKRAFEENKRNVTQRLREYLKVTKTNIWLNELSAIGVYPDHAELISYLEKNGPIPKTYYTENGLLNEADSQWEKANYIISAQENLTKEDKPKVQETEDIEDDIDYETNFVDEVDETDVEEERQNQEGDLFLKQKYIDYVKQSSASNKKYLQFSDWVNNKVSKKARRQAVAIEDIHQQVYSPLFLKNKNLPNFYDWLPTQSNNEKVLDILLFRNVSFYDILPNTESSQTFNESTVKSTDKVTKHKSGLNVTERSTVDKEDGKTKKVYFITDNNNNPIDSSAYTSKKDATLARNKKIKQKKKAPTFDFGNLKGLSKGTVLVKNGVLYTVGSTKEMVDNFGNFYVVESSKVGSRKAEDRIIIDNIEDANTYKEASPENINYIKDASKLKIEEAVKVNPTYDRTISDRVEQIEDGITKQQALLRKLDPEKIKTLRLRITVGPNQSELSRPIEEKGSFQFGTKNENVKIKKNAQLLSIEIYDEEGSYGYFQGPETVLFTDGQANPTRISPFELTESTVLDYFDIPNKMSAADALSIVQNNYAESYEIYKIFKEELKGRDIIETDLTNYPQLMLKLSEGSLTRSKSNPLITFDSLETMFVSEDTSNTIDGERPYFIMDYSRRYERPKNNKEKMKVQGAPITNIDQSSVLFENLMSEVDEFEANYDVLNRMGKYIAFVKLSNGKSAFVGLTAPVYSPESFNELLLEMQNEATRVAEKNVNKDGTVKNKTATKAFNEKIADTIYLAAEPGIYIELGISNVGQLSVKYTNMNLSKRSKNREARGFIGYDELMKFKDVQELINRLNEFVKPIYPTGFTLESIKTSVQKGENDIAILGTLETRFTPEIKNNFRLELRVDPNVVSIDQLLRNGLSTSMPDSSETIDKSTPKVDLTTEEKQDLVLNDYDNVDPNYALDIVKRDQAGEELTEFEKGVLENLPEDMVAGLIIQVQNERTENISNAEVALNQNYQGISFKAEEDLKTFVKRYYETRLVQIKGQNPEISESDILTTINAEMKDIETNPENPLYVGYQTLKKIQEDSDGKAFKITDNFDGNDIEDINTFTNWVRDNLNTDVINISVDNLQTNMINDNMLVGQFMLYVNNLQLAGEISVGTNNPFKYHEAFHAVFRMFLTESEIKRYLKAAKKDVLAKLRSEGKTLSNELAAFRKQHGLYAKLSRKQLEERYLEEFMADEFEAFKMKQKTNVSSETKSLFQKIIDFIKEILGFPGYKLNRLYKNIDAGKYKRAGIQENRFTTAASATPSIAYKSLTLGTKRIKTITDTSETFKTINNYMPSDDQHMIISSAANLFNMRKNNAVDAVDTAAMLDGAINDIIENYNPDRQFYKDKGAIWYIDNMSKIRNYYDSLIRQKDDVKELVRQRLEEINNAILVSQEELEQEEADLGDITVDQWDKTTEMIGGFESAPKLIRELIGSVNIPSQDMFGNKFIGSEENKERVVVGVNYSKVYDSILKATANEPDSKKMFKKLWVWSQGSNVETRAVVVEMFKQLGLLEAAQDGTLFDPAQPFPSMNSETGIKSTLFNTIVNAFENYTTPYLIQLVDSKTGVVQIFEANKADDAHNTLVQWAESFNRKYDEIRIVGSKQNKAASRALGQLAQFINLTSIPENINLIDRSVELSDLVFETTGMKFDSNYILFSLYNRLSDLNIEISEDQKLLFEINQFADPMSYEEIDLIIQSLNSGENLFLDNQELDIEEVDEATSEIQQYYEGGVKGRLRKIAVNNGYFAETVGASTFINEEGNRIYGHQRPTYHLVEIARMTTEDNYVENKQAEDSFLETNFLLNDDKFKSMQESGQIKLFRMSGQKNGVANLTAEGIIKENRGYNKGGRMGTKYGNFTPQQFIVSLINNYTANYNRVNPENSLIGSYVNTNGESVEFAIAPSLIRVIEASNTGDLVMLPVEKMIEFDAQGSINLTDEGYKIFENIIKRDAELIKNELDPETATEDNIIGGNSNSSGQRTNKGRLFQLSHNGKKLLSVYKPRQRNVQYVKDPALGEDTRNAIRQGKQSIVLATEKNANETQLTTNQEGLVDFTIVETQPVALLMKNEGSIISSELSTEETENLIEQLGPYVRKERVKGVRMYGFVLFRGTDAEQIYYTFSQDVAKFFKGETPLVKFSFTDPINNESIKTTITTNESGQEIIDTEDIDTTPAETFEQLINDGATFDEAFKAIDGKRIIEERLLAEVNEFIELLKEFKAINKISADISQGLGVVMDDTNTGTIVNDLDMDNPNVSKLMDLYNLKPGELEFNLMQIFLNDYKNTLSINDILLGDQRLSLKNAIDAIKRAKMQNAAGVNAYSPVIAPELGINHSNENIDMLLYEDSLYRKEFDRIRQEDKELDEEFGERGDGQLLQTTKAHRYMLHGFGELTPQVAAVLDKIEAGKEVEINNEFFGSLTAESYKQMNAIMNSQKLVYGDGKVYLKMSAFTLTPLLTSRQDEEGNFTIPIPGREKLHNLRIKMEAWEKENNSIMIAVPGSASKMMKANMATNLSAFDNSTINGGNVTNLSSKFMRKQMVVPSNKIEIVDPRQIKNLITSEQDLSSKVIWDGVQFTVGDVVDLYHQAQGNKLAVNWFAKRNLTFNFEKIQNDFLNPQTAAGMTIDLATFLKFAIAGLTSSQAKTDMLAYFEMNPDGTGEPTFNLNNQLTRKKFQTLFMSYIAKGTISARQPGISAALVSDDGILFPKRVKRVDENGTPIEWEVIREKQWAQLESEGARAKISNLGQLSGLPEGLEVGDYFFDRLRSDVMMYNEDGTESGVVYTEAVIPPHFKSILQNLPANAPIPDVLAMAYGIRIPSQDKHSAVNVKFIDFLPVYYGSSAMFARELVELSGADFDIDKLYMQIKSFFVDKGKFVEYGKGKNEKENYNHYLNWAFDQAKEKGTPIREAIETYMLSNPELKFNLTEWNNMTQDELDVLNDSEVITRVAMENVGLPVTEEQYKEYKKKYKGREPYSAAIDNKILNYKFILQGNPGMINPRNGRELGVAQEPANLKPLSDANAAEILGVENAGVWDYIQAKLPQLAEIVSEEDIDIDNLRGKLLAFKANKEGAKNIGAAVSPNLTINLAKEFGVSVRTLKDKNGNNIIPVLSIDDIEYRDFVDYTIDPKTGKPDVQGYRTQYVISALITAMTDNAKERLADKLGLNKTALAMVTTMTGLGVDITTSILLVNQPVIRDSFFKAINKDAPTDPGIRKILELRAAQIFKFFETKNNNKIPKTKVTRAMLEEKANAPYSSIDPQLIADEDINEELLYNLSEELSTITQFIIMFDQTEALRNVTTLLNLQKTFGEDLYDVERIADAAKELGFMMTDKEWAGSAKKPNLKPFDFRPVFLEKYKTKPSLHINEYNVFIESYNYLFPKLFLEASENFVDLKKLMMDNMINMYNKKDVDALINNITTYLNTLAYLQSYVNVSENTKEGSSQQTTQNTLNNALIYNGENFGNPTNLDLHISQVFNRLVRNKKTYNYFLDDFLSLKLATNEDNWTGIDKVIANNFTKINDSDTQNIQNSFLDLYTDPDTHIDAIALMHYLLVKDGFNKNNRGTFIDFIPAEIKKNILNSIDSVQTLFNATTQTDAAFKRVFGLTKAELRTDLVTNYLKSTSAQFHVQELDANTKKNTPVLEKFEIVTEEIDIRPGVKTILPFEPKGETIIEDTSESSYLSMTAPKQFKYLGKVYFSVDHAYQVNKSGKFNKAADKDYRAKQKAGKIGGYSRNTKGKENPTLLTSLVKRAFLVNLNKTPKDSPSTYGTILIESSDFAMLGIKQDLAAAYVKGLKQAQQEMIYSKIMFGENAGDFIYITKSASKADQQERQKAQTDVFAVDVDKGIVTIKMYAGLPTEFNNKVKTVRGSFSLNQKDKSVSAILNDNLQTLNRKGIKNIKSTISIGRNQFIQKRQLILPIIARKVMSDGRVVMLELVRYQQDGKYQSDAELETLLSEGQTQVLGNYAEYKIIENGPSGSKDQNPTGFVYGDRPSEAKINKFENDKRDAFAFEIPEAVEELEVEEAPTEETENIEDIEIDVDEETNTVERLMNLQNQSNDILDELELTKDAMIESWYNSLTNEEQQKVGSKDEIMEAYLSYPIDANEFIENLKKCYLK